MLSQSGLPGPRFSRAWDEPTLILSLKDTSEAEVNIFKYKFEEEDWKQAWKLVA